tara:strand:+ start:63 stop:1193 length:1131 start_codon:yes stop_codon:yes gene_type:complete
MGKPITPAARLYVGISRRTIQRVGRRHFGRPILSQQVLATGAGVLISANSMWDQIATKEGRRGFHAGIRESRFQRATLGMDFALDSAGYTAMKAGGYRWEVPDYVEMALHAGRWASAGEWEDAAWSWWAQMDYCVEPDIAKSRREVNRRIRMTANALEEALEEVDYWKREAKGTSYEGTAYPDPTPVLQGWNAKDYLKSIRLADEVFRRTGREWPSVVGLGSVCRRHSRGPAGLLTVIPAVAEALPPHVRLHLFGIKGDAVQRLCGLSPGRISSVDSFAWDLAVRRYVQKQIKSIPCLECGARVNVGCVREDSFFGALRDKEGFCPSRVESARTAGLDVSATLELKSRHLGRWMKTQLKALNRRGRGSRGDWLIAS